MGTLILVILKKIVKIKRPKMILPNISDIEIENFILKTIFNDKKYCLYLTFNYFLNCFLISFQWVKHQIFL